MTTPNLKISEMGAEDVPFVEDEPERESEQKINNAQMMRGGE